MTQMQSLTAPRLALWLMLTLPAVWIGWRYAADIVSYGQVIHFTGDFSVRLLIVTMAATPLRLALPRAALPMWLMRRRRDFGIAVFGYALLHLAVYLARKQQFDIIWSEGTQMDLLTGWIAMALFLPLALTSNDASVRWMRQSWKLLHRLVYPAAALTLLHWLLTAFDPTSAIVHASILAALEAVRIVLMLRRRAG